MNANFSFLKKLAGIWIIIVAQLPLLAQPQPKGPADQRNFQETKDRIEGMRIAFLTQRLDLNREEAQKFWPAYNEYRDAKDKLRQEKREEMRDYSGRFDQLSDKELNDLVDKQIIYRQKELDLQKKYHAVFKEVLPIKKVAQLYKAEDDFKMQMISEAKRRNAD